MCFDSSTRLYSSQLDEQWFNLHKDILRDALDITPTNDNNPFGAPPSSDTVIEYVNTLGHPCQDMLCFRFFRVTKPKAAKKTNPSSRKAPKVTKPTDDKTPKPTSFQPPKPILAPIEPSKKDQGNKRKLVKEASDTPSHAKRSKAGKVTKNSMQKSLVQLVDEFDDEGKGKEKVVDEQAAHNLLTLQTPKKKSHADQFVFQRRTPMPTEPSRHAESPFLDEEVPEINTRDQDEGQAGPNPGNHDEGQAGSNLEATDASTQQNPKQMDEEFTTTAYPNVQENLKLLTEDQVILEDPTSSTGTLSSLQNLEKELSFTNHFLMEKPHEEEPEKTNTEYEVQSMVTVPIHQDTSLVPPMTTPVIDLAVSQPVSTTVQTLLPTSTTTATTITTTTTLPPPPPHPQQSTTYSILLQCTGDWAMQAPLRACFSDLPAINMKEILQQRMFEDKSYEAYEDNKNLLDALQKSLKRDYSNQLLSDLEAARQKKRKRRDLPRTPSRSPPSYPSPPPLPLPAGASGALGSAQQQGSKAPNSSKIMATTPQSMAWTTYDTRYKNDHLPKADTRKDWWKLLPEKERPVTPEPAWIIPSSNVSDIENNWASALVSTYEPPAENLLLAKIGDMTTFLNWCCQKMNNTVLTQADFQGRAYEVVKSFYPDVIHL
nr:hypothetical protein [Tanacetum cinerariifolium]